VSSVEEATANAKVGGLWYLVEEEEGKRQFFVVDIQIYDAYRRHGYGSQAFQAMEGKAREMGITTISLHVFGHNHPAKAMYDSTEKRSKPSQVASEWAKSSHR